jgi:CheY-like chemotaxis protein
MPEIDGAAVLKTIKEHAGLRDVRIAMFVEAPAFRELRDKTGSR